jgi:DNA-binding NtrC family response regulator/pSer/pThr/pTyr-binding forkhead associated (FHA) protein
MIDDRTTANVAVITDTDADEAVARSFLVVTTGSGSIARTRVVPLPDGKDVTFGRSTSCTVSLEYDGVSRLHARVVKRGAHVILEDLGSRNGTWLNGARISAPQRISPGDEFLVGPATAMLAVTTSVRRSRTVGSVSDLEERLDAEVDRASRYRRRLGLVMLRLEGPGDGVVTALDHIAATLRRMDLLAEYGPDEFAVILPEADRLATSAVARRLAREARAMGHKHGEVVAHVGSAVFPDDGPQPGELLGVARASLRAARTGQVDTRTPVSGVATVPGSEGIISVDPVMKRVFALAKKIADASITALIVGETGVGKEVVAEAIHRDSSRRNRPFVKLNCASLPESILERELFGHERGAFTGADSRKAGFFEAAHGGTIFLDEIGELPVGAQAKLLRVLERRTITRLGGTTEIPVDVRVVCATNRDLETEVARGRFREDLYFRISAFVIPVPPIRDRRSEIAPLALHFARHFARELGQRPPSFTHEALALLESYEWPGNVRELRNAVERAVVLQSGGIIDEAQLPDRVRDQTSRAGGGGEAAEPIDVHQRVAQVEREAVVAALEASHGNQTRAAKRLGISRFALIRLMNKYGLKPTPSTRKPR